MFSFSEFLNWEKTTRDTIDFKKVYVDMAGDLISGLLLSQIVFWSLPDKEGHSKLRVKKDGHLWIAKKQDEWWDEVRLTKKQVERAMSILVKKGLIVKKNFMFDGLRTNHTRINEEGFMKAWHKAVQGGRPVAPKSSDRNPQKVATGHDEKGRPITETTSQTTSQTTTVVERATTTNTVYPPSIWQGKLARSHEGVTATTITALEIYQEVTHVQKPKPKIVEWCKGWDERGFDPDLMREAIISADTQNKAVDVRFLDKIYCRLDKYSWRADSVQIDYTYREDEVIRVDHVIDSGKQVPVEDLPSIAQQKLFEAAIRYHRGYYTTEPNA